MICAEEESQFVLKIIFSSSSKEISFTLLLYSFLSFFSLLTHTRYTNMKLWLVKQILHTSNLFSFLEVGEDDPISELCLITC